MIRISARKETSVGLDIGTYSIKAVSVEKETEKNTLTAYNIKKIPLEPKNVRIETLIKETFDEIDLNPEYVNLSISGADVIVRFINLPKMNMEQLGNALVFEAEKYIPFNISEVVLDYMILGDAAEPGQMKVLLAAAKREPIEARVKTIEEMGMIVNVMDIDPLAMFNAFHAANPSLADKGSVFLNLGHTQTDILISTSKMPCFMREVQIGGKDITNAISEGLSVSKEKAEGHKINPGKDNAESVFQAAVPVLDDMIKEMQLSFGYFENRYNRGISDIYCSGGTTYQQGVVEYLSEKLGFPVKKWMPTDGMEISEILSREDVNSIASQLSVGIGLALRN